MRCSIWIFEVAFGQRQPLHFHCLRSLNSLSGLHCCCSPQQILLQFFFASSVNSLSVKHSSLMSNKWLPLVESSYQRDLFRVELIDSWNGSCFQFFCSWARRFGSLKAVRYSLAKRNSGIQVQVDCSQYFTMRLAVYQHSFDREGHP